ncbi:hypothetical protein BaRGS_00006683 [Batillaria attramentaria]|uniref:Uncharacterized protein n=1 Tax=Batillaria attramentaria TaxID=370345 RepID=A0ABD0LRX5_9CAEN
MGAMCLCRQTNRSADGVHQPDARATKRFNLPCTFDDIKKQCSNVSQPLLAVAKRVGQQPTGMSRSPQQPGGFNQTPQRNGMMNGFSQQAGTMNRMPQQAIEADMANATEDDIEGDLVEGEMGSEDMEGDMDDFPEEWMVLDDVDEENLGDAGDDQTGTRTSAERDSVQSGSSHASKGDQIIPLGASEGSATPAPKTPSGQLKSASKQIESVTKSSEKRPQSATQASKSSQPSKQEPQKKTQPVTGGAVKKTQSNTQGGGKGAAKQGQTQAKKAQPASSASSAKQLEAGSGEPAKLPTSASAELLAGKTAPSPAQTSKTLGKTTPLPAKSANVSEKTVPSPAQAGKTAAVPKQTGSQVATQAKAAALKTPVTPASSAAGQAGAKGQAKPAASSKPQPAKKPQSQQKTAIGQGKAAGQSKAPAQKKPAAQPSSSDQTLTTNQPTSSGPAKAAVPAKPAQSTPSKQVTTAVKVDLKGQTKSAEQAATGSSKPGAEFKSPAPSKAAGAQAKPAADEISSITVVTTPKEAAAAAGEKPQAKESKSGSLVEEKAAVPDKKLASDPVVKVERLSGKGSSTAGSTDGDAVSAPKDSDKDDKSKDLAEKSKDSPSEKTESKEAGQATDVKVATSPRDPEKDDKSQDKQSESDVKPGNKEGDKAKSTATGKSDSKSGNKTGEKTQDKSPGRSKDTSRTRSPSARDRVRGKSGDRHDRSSDRNRGRSDYSPRYRRSSRDRDYSRDRKSASDSKKYDEKRSSSASASKTSTSASKNRAPDSKTDSGDRRATGDSKRGTAEKRNSAQEVPKSEEKKKVAQLVNASMQTDAIKLEVEVPKASGKDKSTPAADVAPKLSKSEIRKLDEEQVEKLLEAKTSALENGLWRFAVRLSPVELADVAQESLRKLLNGAQDCAIFLKNQGTGRKKKGDAKMYFSRMQMTKYAMQKLFQTPLTSKKLDVEISRKLLGSSDKDTVILDLDLTNCGLLAQAGTTTGGKASEWGCGLLHSATQSSAVRSCGAQQWNPASSTNNSQHPLPHQTVIQLLIQLPLLCRLARFRFGIQPVTMDKFESQHCRAPTQHCAEDPASTFWMQPTSRWIPANTAVGIPTREGSSQHHITGPLSTTVGIQSECGPCQQCSGDLVSTTVEFQPSTQQRSSQHQSRGPASTTVEFQPSTQQSSSQHHSRVPAINTAEFQPAPQ